MNRDFLDMMLVLDHTHSVILTILCYYCPASGSARISKSGGLEYVNIGTPEETLLETYFVTLSKFNFDRAREQCVSLVFNKYLHSVFHTGTCSIIFLSIKGPGT